MQPEKNAAGAALGVTKEEAQCPGAASRCRRTADGERRRSETEREGRVGGLADGSWGRDHDLFGLGDSLPSD